MVIDERTTTRPLAVLSTAVLLAALPAGGAHALAAPTAAQAEAFTLSSSLGRVLTDRAAEGGRSLQIWSNGTATGTLARAGATSALSLRVRGDQCGGAPQMRVSLDGRELSTTTVPQTAWTTVRVPVAAPAGDHRVAVAFTNDHRTASCDRNLHVDAVTAVPAASVPVPAVPVPAVPVPGGPPAGSASSPLFRADVAASGLSAYTSTHNAHRVSVVDDPVLGGARKVLRFRVYDTDDQLTGNPRAQLESQKFWRAGEEHYVGVSYYFPHDWPMQQDTRQWVNLGEVYGAPYAGASPNALFVKRVSSGGQVIAWQRNGTYGWDRPFEVPLVKGRWHDFVFRIKLSADPQVGFWEAWLNTGSGWQRLQLHGKDRLHSKTLDASNSGGANYHKLAHYRSKGMWPVATHYAADHAIGDSFDAVAPHSHP